MINKNNYICSRSVADSYAYIKYAIQNTKQDYIRDMLLPLKLTAIGAGEVQHNQDNIINVYVPITFKLTTDGNHLRVTDEKYQQRIDTLIVEYYERYNIPYYTLTSKSLEDRIEELKGVIDND